MNIRSFRLVIQPGALLICFATLAFLLFSIILRVSAQETDEDIWSTPVNLSNSGGASDPVIVVDKDGVVHVVWVDRYAGSVYSRGVFTDTLTSPSGVWSAPAAIEFPFEDWIPMLVNGGDYIHAFWINRDKDNTLFYSRVVPANFQTPGSWEAPRPLSKYVVGMSAVSQSAGQIQIAYIHNLEESQRPEGIYYQRSDDNGNTWKPEILLYTSKYLRSMKLDDANVQISATFQGDQEVVSVVWDNPLLKRVFYARSIDGGVTWEPAAEVDGPYIDGNVNAPFKIKILTNENRAVRIWQSNLQSGVYCSQYYQFSNNGGEAWSERRLMLENLTGCATENRMFRMADGAFLLQTTIQEQVYLLAWNGERWSDPRPQSLLYTFDNPLTNDVVTFRCRQSTLPKGDVLYVVGCDVSSGGDIWVTWRKVGDVRSWFPPPSNWSQPLKITESSEEIYSLQGVFDEQGRYHILWVQNQPEEERKKRSIYYSVFSQDTPSLPSLILESPDNYVDSFSTAVDFARSRLVVAWNSGQSGEIYYSWADTATAYSALEWADPVVVPSVHPLARSPNILVLKDGAIYISYVIPINEDRGVYIVKSLDGGETWSQPVRVYDADNSSWQMVDSPKLATDKEQNLHLLWTQNVLFAAPSAIGLYYARSEDGGETWSAPQVAVNSLVEKIWMINAGQKGLHRFWLSPTATGTSIFQDFSNDGGVNWSLPSNLTGLGEIPQAVVPYVDFSDRLGMVQIFANPVGKLAIKDQTREGENWKIEDVLDLYLQSENVLPLLAAAKGLDERLFVLYTDKVPDTLEAVGPWQILLQIRNKSSASAIPTSVETTGPSSTSSPEATSAQPVVIQATISPSVTPAPDALTPTPIATAPILNPQGPGSANGTTMGLVLAGGVAVMVVLAFVAYTRIRRS
ncbi:MAG: hypothetical protein QME21_13860 [Anaerolineales bacterium]|nr:hypothetical protein [Anaerolineales bacterium]